MFPSQVTLKEGAFLVTDAHYSPLRPDFLEFMKDINSQKLQPSQLILMGDIFDTLLGEVAHTHINNRELITVLNKISQKIEIIYLEGNHDFNLQKIFPNIEIFPIEKQPIMADYKTKKIYLSHGDINGGWSYKIYSLFIRNSFVLSLVSLIDSIGSHFILRKLDETFAKKDDCKELDNFQLYTEKRLEQKYICDYFIDGHFHQNKRFTIQTFTYINLAAFACNQRYFSVKLVNDKELLEEHIFSKGIKE